MSPPDLLTETDFLIREFPVPAGPYRPLAVISPPPGGDEPQAARVVQEAARNGYGGLVLDPSGFGPDFLTKAWFDQVGYYLEACRMTGLFLWLLDGFTLGSSLLAILDRTIPAWRAPAVTARPIAVTGPSRVDLSLPVPPDNSLLAILARPADRAEPPINLLACVEGDRLQWDAPPGHWEVWIYRRGLADASPAPALDWADGTVVGAWIRAAFKPYRDFFPTNLGRTLQGFFVFCPTWPSNNDEVEHTWPLSSQDDPSFLDLTRFIGAARPAADQPSYAARFAETVRRSYLTALRNWCWRHRLKIAGYRLGGSPLPGMLADLDLGGLPDLDAGAPPDPDELAALAGLARYYRQDKTACQFPATGEMNVDRGAVSRLAAAGANLYLIRRGVWSTPGGEPALNDYAARLAMAVSAGAPVEEIALPMENEPESLLPLGREILGLSRQGLEAVCLPAAEAVDASAGGAPKVEAHSTARETAVFAEGETAGRGMAALPQQFALRARRVDNMSVYTLINQGKESWRGPVVLPAAGSAEIWSPSTGEQRPAAALDGGSPLRLPMALAPGEAVLAVLRRHPSVKAGSGSRVVRAHLTLGRSWHFEAPGGNSLPLTWHEHGLSHWVGEFTVLAVPELLRLVERPAACLTWLNGRLLPVDENKALNDLLLGGTNRLEIRGAREMPSARLRGEFTCAGGAVAPAAGELAGPWTQNGYPYFTGPGIYRQSFTVPAELLGAGLTPVLEVSALADSAVVRLNGEPAGYLPWPPFRLELGPGRLQAGENRLEIEVHAPASKTAWSFKGLLGEAVVYFIEARPKETGLASGLDWLEEMI